MNVELLLAYIRSLPCLPKGTMLDKPDEKREQQILEQILDISGTMNPIQWLMFNQPELCINTTLWLLLRDLKLYFTGIQRSIRLNMFPEIDGDNVDFVQSSQFAHSLDLLQTLADTSPVTVSSDLLLNVFSDLYNREIQRHIAKIHRGSRWELLSRLLSLYDNSSPLIWLQDFHLEQSAIMTLEYLVDHIIPSFSLWDVSPTIRTLSLKTPNKSKNIKVTLQDISIKHNAFSISLTFRILNRQLKVNSQEKAVHWHDVGQIRDNLGNCYLICYPGLEYTKRFWWVDYKLQLLCYPAIDNSAEWICLSFKNPSINAIDIRNGDVENAQYYEVSLDSLKWTVDVR